MGLLEVKNGCKAVIVSIGGGHAVRNRLINLGIVPGIPIRIVRKDGRNPMILSVMGHQVMLGYSLAKMVVVR